MKSVVAITILFSILISSTFGATARGVFNDPKNPGKCTINANLIMSPGEEAKDPNQACGRILCGNNGFAEFQTCGVQAIDGCVLGDYADKSLPYPDCCKRLIVMCS